MPASPPVRLTPLTVTVLPVPAFLVSNAPVALVPTLSPLTTPLKATALTVATVPPSYTLSDTVAPPTVKLFGVMSALRLPDVAANW